MNKIQGKTKAGLFIGPGEEGQVKFRSAQDNGVTPSPALKFSDRLCGSGGLGQAGVGQASQFFDEFRQWG